MAILYWLTLYPDRYTYMFFLSKRIAFPPVHNADDNGLLAVGGDLSVERLLLAYKSGIFPWYNDDEPILWWCPDPRCVLFPAKLKISKSMRQLMKDNAFVFTINEAFEEVVRQCKTVSRKGQDGTWISGEVENAYAALYKSGYACSAEAWLNGELVGGLYGVRIDDIFFGESMFSKVSNASKFAFIKYIQFLGTENVQLVDCQVHTQHLESLGAEMIPRKNFIALLEQYIR